MKKVYLLLTLFIAVGLTDLNAQILLQWNTFGNAGNETVEPSVFNDPNLSGITNLTLGAGVTAALNGNRFGGNAWFDVGDTNPTTLGESVTGNDYIQFIVTPNVGFSFTATSFVFSWDHSATGPTSVTLRSSVDGFVADLGSVTAMPVGITSGNTITISGITGITTATTFRLYGYGATAAGGTGGFDVASSVVNVQLNGTTSAASAPAITVTPGSLTGFTALSGVPSAEQTYTVGGINMTNDILITPPAGFEISLTSGTETTTPITLTQSGGNVPTTTIYVRMNSATLGLNTGNITNTSAGSNNPSVALTGHVITTEPTVQSAITFGTVTTNSIVVNFSGGNGAKRILLAHQLIPVNSDPVDGTTYTANASFGAGTQIGTGNYVVYAGTGNTVTVTGLSPSSLFNFAVYEYNDAGVAGAENYLTTSPGTGVTATLSTDGDYRSIATGNWSDILIWQTRVANLWVPAVTVPSSASNVFIQIGHTVTVDIATATCNDLHINNATSVLAIDVNTLEVNGKLRSYIAAAAETTLGVDGIFYTGQVSTNLPNSTNITSIAGTGKMRFVGSTRTITFTGEWGNNPPGWDVEFAPTAGQTLTLQTGLKARNITAVSGTTVSSNTDMRPDGGAAGLGSLTVKTGATLQYSNNSITLQRVGGASATSHFGTLTVETGGVLEFSGTSSPIIGAGAYALNGTVVYSGGGAQSFAFKGGNTAAADPITYTNVTISNSGVKTTVGSLTTTINGTFSLQGTTTAALGASAVFAYGASGVLEYKGSAAQTTVATPAEWPTVSGPFSLTIDNTNGVTFSATGGRRINGALTLTNGILTTSSASVLTMGPASTVPTLPTNANFVSGPVQKIGNADFTFPIGKIGTGYVPIGVSNFTGTLDPVNDAFTAEYIRASATALGAVTDPLIKHVSACDYWTLDRTSGTQTANVTGTWSSNNPCNANQYVTSLAELALVHFNGTNWDASSVGFSGTTGGPATGTITWPGVTTYSPFSLGTTTWGANPLPITINYFNGSKQNGNHLLNWKVTNTNSSSVSMEIQRSSDGRIYTGIYNTNATAVQCLQPFAYTDNQPAKGVNYYRLKMTDVNGKISYSNIVPLINADNGVEVMNIAPNPIVNRNFNLNVSAAQKTNMEIVITDMQGRMMQKRSVNMIAGFNSIPVNVSGFGSGTYQVYGVTAEGRSKVLRFVIQ